MFRSLLHTPAHKAGTIVVPCQMNIKVPYDTVYCMYRMNLNSHMYHKVEIKEF